MCSLVHAVFLRSLPFPQPERIVMLFEAVPSAGVDRQGFAPANYADPGRRAARVDPLVALRDE